MSEIITKKKRGRKPKSYISSVNKNPDNQTDTNMNSEDEKIIFHLPITINEINNDDSANLSIFIKPEKETKNNSTLLKQMSSNDSDTNSTTRMYETTDNLKIDFGLNNNINKIITHNLNFNKSIKCFWCKNHFDSPACQLPEDYYNGTFYCKGNFCSFNCKLAYNLDLNDSLTYKRESLINLLYYLTYGEYIKITPAPHWMTLDEYGGPLTIQQFRENFIINNKEYLVLHPPLISRQMQIEESYKMSKLKEVPIDKVNKIYSEVDSEYVIKRSKPVQSSQLNLESTMGLVRLPRKNNKKIF